MPTALGNTRASSKPSVETLGYFQSCLRHDELAYLAARTNCRFVHATRRMHRLDILLGSPIGELNQSHYDSVEMERPTNEELGLNEKGFPPTDESGDVDVNQLEWNLRLTPAERLRRAEAIREFTEAARQDRIRRYGFDPADFGPAE